MTFALQIIIPLYLAVFFVVAFAGRSYLVYRQTGINPYVVGRSDRPIDFVENYYPVALILIAITTLAFSFAPGLYQFATPIVWLESPAVQSVGLALMLLALIWVALAQTHMGKSWRFGIDTKTQTKLIEKGLFALSRNPIFLGMRVSLLGLFLAMPNAVILASVVLADVLMQVQVRLEEQFLSETHGEKYREFQKRVRRWI